jgi:myo-inositol-1(or 4)-monophosphatase
MPTTRTFLDKIADAADAATLPLFRSGLAVDAKSAVGAEFDPVTEADRAAERAMRAVIADAFPDHGIAGEEYGLTNAGARDMWHLDPIDGTRQFITGVPLWGTMAGYARDGSPVSGVISQPFTRERFYGGPEGAYYRGPGGLTAMRTKRCDSLADAWLFTTSPHLYRGPQAEALDRLRAAVRLTRYGLDCYAFALLALGAVDIVIETGLQDYDIVPIVPIVEAAGGAVVLWSGERATTGGDVLAVGDARLLGPVLALLQGK